MIRIKGDAGTGNVVNAVEHCRALFGEIRRLKGLAEEELFLFSKEH
jgi:pyridoxal 5'-phosphate synthase pdxS subunit